jgi:16S rRNA processing protein RimM
VHGLKGELTCLILTDFPERFEQTRFVHLVPPQGAAREVELERARQHHGRVRLKIKGVDTVEQAQALRNYLVAVPEDELVDLDEGEFYHFELEGMDVVDEEGRPVGVLEEVLALPAHELYVIRGPLGELLLPAVEAYVLEVDLESNVMRVRVPEVDED